MRKKITSISSPWHPESENADSHSLWKDYFKENPTKEGYYLVEVMEENGAHTWFEVQRFENQDEYETRFSKEFNQNVRILTKSGHKGFKERGCFVLRWMEIPK